MTIKWLSLIVSLTLIATILSAPSRVLAAPKLYFDPTTVTIKKDQEFIVPVKIDVESAQTIGTDITINYAGEDQEVISVDNTYFFSEFNSANTTIGKLEIHAFSSSIHQAKTGSGTVANIKFKAKRDNGSSAITFNCNGTGDDTNDRLVETPRRKIKLVLYPAEDLIGKDGGGNKLLAGGMNGLAAGKNRGEVIAGMAPSADRDKPIV